MSLAQELLAAGRPAVILEYLDLCRAFWQGGAEELDQWQTQIRNGQPPTFRGYLL